MTLLLDCANLDDGREIWDCTWPERRGKGAGDPSILKPPTSNYDNPIFDFSPLPSAPPLMGCE